MSVRINAWVVRAGSNELKQWRGMALNPLPHFTLEVVHPLRAAGNEVIVRTDKGEHWDGTGRGVDVEEHRVLLEGDPNVHRIALQVIATAPGARHYRWILERVPQRRPARGITVRGA